jgi:hypothetical protein
MSRKGRRLDGTPIWELTHHALHARKPKIRLAARLKLEALERRGLLDEDLIEQRREPTMASALRRIARGD